MFGIQIKFSTVLGIVAAAVLIVGGSGRASAQPGTPTGLKGHALYLWQQQRSGTTSTRTTPSTRVGPVLSPSRTYGYRPFGRQEVIPSTPLYSVRPATSSVTGGGCR